MRESTEQRPFTHRRVLRGDQRRSRPLTTDGKSLSQAHDYQQQRRQPADGMVGRQQADQKGGNTHGQQRIDQRGLAADLVTQMPEEHRTQWTRDHRRAKDGKGRQQRDGLVTGRKEQMRKYQHRRGGIDVEVVELDGGTDQTGEHDAGAGVGRGLGESVGFGHGR